MKPTGNVTFLFTDIEGSTKLAQDHPEKLSSALARHNEILRIAIESYNGHVFKIIGDAYCCAFENAGEAVKAAVEIQINLSKEKWDEAVVKIRIGIHSGNAEWNGHDYMGYITLARASRVMSAAYGEQILVSNDAHILCREDIELSFRDLGERRLKDVIEPIRLYQVLSKDLREDFPPLKTLDARPNNLPIQLTSFIGREKELKILKDKLKPNRLLTLTATGGAGKSRLSLQTGADLIDDFANGVWFVELAAVSDPYFLPISLINALGIKEETKKTPEETLVDYLKDKELLLILDNCEHLINACAELTVKLLTSCPKLKIIATSREALNCAGELTFRIPPLSQPDPKANNTPEQLVEYESVRLFIERAISVNPKFRVNNENAPALAEVCSRLDGIPLALELAAARTKVLSIEKIFERLTDRFNLLTGGKRTALPRQQTLKALIGWSYDLLCDEEKLLWKRLSVFSGGFNLEASEEICSDERLKNCDILDLLSNLNEKSIINYDEAKERYIMLETIKEYGKELFTDPAESMIIKKNHFKYFFDLASSVKEKLFGKNQKEYFDLIEVDDGNFQSAFSIAMEENKINEAAGLAFTLNRYWIVRGRAQTGNKWYDAILYRENDLSEEVFSNVLTRSAGIKVYLGQYDIAMEFYNKFLALMKKKNDKKEISLAIYNIGITAARMGDYKNARLSFEEYLAFMREEGDTISVLNSVNSLAQLEMQIGNYDKALTYCKESLTLIEDINDIFESYYSFRNMGKLESYLGNYEQAAKMHLKAIELSRRNGYKSGLAVSLAELGGVKAAQKDFSEARKLLEESLIEGKGTDESICLAMAYSILGSLEYKSENFQESRIQLNKSLKIFREIGDVSGIADAIKLLSIVEYNLKDFDSSEKTTVECLKTQISLGLKLEIAKSLLLLVKINSEVNKFEAAASLLGNYKNYISSSEIQCGERETIDYENLYDSVKKVLGEDFISHFEDGMKLQPDEI